MFPAFDYNHEKDEYRNGYDNGQGDKGYDDGENEFASNHKTETTATDHGRTDTDV